MRYMRFSNQSPIWSTFTVTALSAMCLIAGVSGYRLNRHARFVDGPWSDAIIWWEVGVGAVLIPVAIYFWRRGATEVERRVARPPIKTATD